MQASSTGPDVRQLNEQELAKSEFPGGREQLFRVFIDPKTHKEIWKHAQTDTNVEICGVLVGIWAKDEQGPFLNVSASIRGEAAEKKFAEVTFTHDTWAAINAEMDSKYTDRSIVGWYHTHPDFGIFLSDRDRFIQENFFSAPGQVALVVDPVREVEGIFTWEAGKTELTPHYWVGNELVISSEGSDVRRPRSDGISTANDVVKVAELARSPSSHSDWISLLQKTLQYLIVFLAGWLLAGRLNDWMLDRVRQEGVAIAVFKYGLKQGLEIRLSELQTDLVGIAGDAQQILADHNERLGEKDVTKEDRERQSALWKNVEMRLNRSAGVIEQIDREYCLDDEQRLLLKQFLDTQTNQRRIEDEQRKKTLPATPASHETKDKTKSAEEKQTTGKLQPPSTPPSEKSPDADMAKPVQQ